jgi:hypothetical protein
LFYHYLHFSDAFVRQTSWSASKVRDKLILDVDLHALHMKNERLLEKKAKYKVILLIAYIQPLCELGT